jgi:hypothetical protein
VPFECPSTPSPITPPSLLSSRYIDPKTADAEQNLKKPRRDSHLDQQFGNAAFSGRNKAVQSLDTMGIAEKKLFNAFAYGVPFKTREMTKKGSIVHQWVWVRAEEALSSNQMVRCVWVTLYLNIGA